MENTEYLFERMLDKNEQEAYKYAVRLAKTGDRNVFDKAIELLKGNDMEAAFLATQVLANMDNRQEALGSLLDAIHDHKNRHRNGALVASLEAFDLGEKFVDILRIYLFGNFKSSSLAKDYLDHTEFDVTPRVLRKAKKHWQHFKNNSNQDEAFEIKNAEVQEIFHDLDTLLGDEDTEP